MAIWSRATNQGGVEHLALRTKPFVVIETIGSVATIILFLGAVLRLGTGKSAALWQLVLVVWMCLTVTALVAIVFIQERRTRRRFAYAVSLQPMHQVLHELRDAEAAILQRNAGQSDVVPEIARMLTAASQVFSTITGQWCRTCIKQVHYPSPTGQAIPVGDDSDGLRELRVSTMVRDDQTGIRPGDGSSAYVDQNTDFELLFLHRHDHRWFWSNDLESLDAYKNSSWVPGKPKEYVATAVWPIQKADPTQDAVHDTLGFFCVDTLAKGVFDGRFDFYVGAAIADALYPLLKLMHIQKRGGDPSACPA